MRRTCLFSTCPIPTAISIGRGMTKGRISEQPTRRTSQSSGTWPRVSPIRKKNRRQSPALSALTTWQLSQSEAREGKRVQFFSPFSRTVSHGRELAHAYVNLLNIYSFILARFTIFQLRASRFALVLLRDPVFFARPYAISVRCYGDEEARACGLLSLSPIGFCFFLSSPEIIPHFPAWRYTSFFCQNKHRGVELAYHCSHIWLIPCN